MERLDVFPQRAVLTHVRLCDFEEEPGPFCMSFGFGLKGLIESIRNCGIINPPIVTRLPDGRPEVILGYRRMLAAKALGYEAVPCKDITESGLPLIWMFLLSFYDNLPTRSFNDVEKGMILKRLLNYTDKGDLKARYLPLLELPPRESTLDFYLRLEELDLPIKLAVAKRRLGIPALKSLLSVDNMTRGVLFDLIQKLNLNFNKQYQFIEYINDIAIINQTSTINILLEQPLLTLINDSKITISQKTDRVMAHLRSRRYPSLSRAEEAIKEKVSRLPFPTGARITYPPFFEAPGYCLEVKFGDGKELRQKLSEIVELNELEGIGDQWRTPYE